MSSLNITFFYMAIFFLAALFCIPIGPVNLEVFHKAMKKQISLALFLATGAALGDSVWATFAFFGISPFQRNKYLEAGFLLATAIITFILGILAIKGSKKEDAKEHLIIEENIKKSKEQKLIQKFKGKRWSFLQGLTMVLINPLGIFSWMIALALLKESGIFIGLELKYEILFFITVFLGAFSYFVLLIFLTRKMKKFFTPKKTKQIILFVGYILIAFSFYFIYNFMKILIYGKSAM